MTKKKLEAKIKKSSTEYDGFLKIRKYEIERDKHEGGKEDITWYVMERGHAVGVLAYDPVRDVVVLVNEMRTGVLVDGGEPFTDTIPAGMIDKGETPLDAAIRETKEETGLTLKDAKVIHEKAYVSAGGTSESIALVFGIVDASKAGGVHGKAAEHENIKVIVMKTGEFMRKVKSGEINDLKSMVAAYWLQENKPALQLSYRQSMKAEFEAAARKNRRDEHFALLDKGAAESLTGMPFPVHVGYRTAKQLTDPDQILAAHVLWLLGREGGAESVAEWFETNGAGRKQALLDAVSLLALSLPSMRDRDSWNGDHYYPGGSEWVTLSLHSVLANHFTPADIEKLVLADKSLAESMALDAKDMKELMRQEAQELHKFLADFRTHYASVHGAPGGAAPHNPQPHRPDAGL